MLTITAGDQLNRISIPHLVDIFTRTLNQRGYRPMVVQAYRRAVEHFLSWLTAEAQELSGASVQRFVDEHLSICQCPGRLQKNRATVRPALRRLLDLLRATGLLAVSHFFPPVTRAELDSYDSYARSVCGLASATLVSRRLWIGRFLTHCFPASSPAIDQLRPRDIHAFFQEQCQHCKAGTANVIASAVRSYLRFRAVQHADSIHSVMAAVPTAAQWRLAALPNYLNKAELDRLMAAAVPPAEPQRQRDYAVLRCLVDLGLRSCEVAALRLDDIDWTSGTIAIPTGKSNRTDLLPLPEITGQALTVYLRYGRPETHCRAVFVRHRAPLDEPVNTSVIRSVVRQAAARAGLADRLRGPHQLRHSAATRMLEAGATLKEIADVLRHRSLDTTAVYAKVDHRRLIAIAQPWPGGAQ